MQEHCLVTGGAGFIGSHVVDKLVELGHKVSVIDDFSLGKEKNLEKSKEKITLYRKNICDNLHTIFKEGKFTCVFHMAALPRVQFSINEPIKTHEVNVNGTLNLLTMCKEYGVKRFVFTSSSSVYGDQKELPLIETMIPNPMSPYALHKLIGEHYCKIFTLLYGVETISLRYFNVYGTRQDPESAGYATLIPKFSKKMLDGETPIINGDGTQTRDLVHVSDVVNANIVAFTTDKKECFGDFFNVGSGNNHSVQDITEQIRETLQSKVKPIHGPAVIEPKNTLAGIRKIKERLGWEPKTEFTRGLRETVLSFK